MPYSVNPFTGEMDTRATAGSIGAITNLDVDTFTSPGTDPVNPAANDNITITGGQISSGAVGTNVIQTHSKSTNSVTIEIQRAGKSVSSDITLNGVAHFDSNNFDIDANGFVTTLSNGDVEGPASSVDDNLATFDGITGKLIQDSGFSTNSFLKTANNLSDLANATTARSNLGLGSLAVLNSPLSSANGGTGQTTYATGDLIYATALNTLGKLAAGSNTQVLTLAAGVPTWSTPASGTVTSVSGTANQVAVATGTTTPVISLVGPYTPATYTDHGVLIGKGTSSIVALGAGQSGQVLQSGGASADPTWSTATYPSTTTINQLLYSSAANTVAGLPTANRAVLTTTGAGVPVMTALATDGQLIIGSTAGSPAAATLTAGTGVTITNGSNSISIAVNGSTVGQTLTGNSGGAIAPVAGNWNLLGTGSITIAGSGSTLTTQLTGITNHAIQIGAGTATLTQLAIGSTGQVLQANTTADPTWSTATYPSTTTANQLLYSSANNVVSELATANSKFPATNSSGTLAMRGFSTVIQTFTSNGTYTPTTGMQYCIIEVVGSGGGGGGTASTTAAQLAMAGGGGAGEYARGTFSAASIGASKSVTCPAGGSGGAAGANNGVAGGTTSVTGLITAAGGSGGQGSTAIGTSGINYGGTGGTGGTGGSFRTQGSSGSFGIVVFGSMQWNGRGARGAFSGGGPEQQSTGAGLAGIGFGSGGNGAFGFVSAAAQAGGAGASGIVVITEFVIN